MMHTEEQEAAIQTDDERVVIEAGPGAGKTMVIGRRIAHLLMTGTKPEDILALTFTRSACQAIRASAAVQAGDELAARVTIRTFHAFAYMVVKSLNPRMAVSTERQSEVAFCSLYNGGSRRRHVTPKIRLRSALMRYEAVGPHCGDKEVDDAIGDISCLLQRLMDAQLVPTWALANLALFSSEEVPSYEHVLVDELQDCTENELTLAHQATLGCGSLFMVGDPRQAIMGWRGARSWDYEVTHRLTKTFRFSEVIAAVANDLADRHGWGRIVGHDGPGEVVRNSDLRMMPIMHGSKAILCRTNDECRQIAASLDGAVHVCSGIDPLSAPADVFDSVRGENLIAVATVHSAKGREWDHVAVRLHPGGDDEEQRVRYVALTRARRTLLL